MGVLSRGFRKLQLQHEREKRLRRETPMNRWTQEQTSNFINEVKKSGQIGTKGATEINFAHALAVEPRCITIHRNACSGQVLLAFKIAALLGVTIEVTNRDAESEQYAP